MTPDELGIVAKGFAEWVAAREREWERRSYPLRDIAYRFELEARAARFGPASMIASVTNITDAPSRREVWRRCEECGRSTDKLRRGLCGAHYQAWRRAQAGHTATMGA
jgi:hypothetical protein